MFLRVVILVFAATCCTAQINGVCDIVQASAWERSGKFEGDIMLTDDKMRNGLNDTARRWPKGEVPFVIDSVFTNDERGAIVSALCVYHRNTPIRFRQYNQQTDSDYIHITGENTSCWSFVGRIGGRQQLNLQRGEFGCIWHGTIIHELQHALGFHHQHRVPDRDNYITIHLDNVVKGKEENFQPFNASYITSFGVPYDYDSIMHYDRCAFSKNGKPTIEPKNPNAQIGQRAELSAKDIQKLQLMYGNSPNATYEDSLCPTTATTENSSYATRSQFITLIIVTLLVLTHLQ